MNSRANKVKAYLEAQIDLPRKLWRPTVVVIDEAQLFAPEKGFGESIALEAIMDWMFRQRKHGIGSILATPRLSMLNKNVAGANNIFIGRTQLDTDQARAGKALGMSNKEAIGLRDLKGRQFFCYGPALNVKGVTLFRVRDCETTIPEPGVHKHLAPPKASHVVAQLADKLKDIQQEAETEIRTLNDAKAEVAKLKRELRAAKSGAAPRDQDTKRIAELEAALKTAREQTKTETKIKEVPALKDSQITRFEKRLDQVERLVNSLVDVTGKVSGLSLLDELKQLRSVLTELKAPMQPAASMPQPARPVAQSSAPRISSIPASAGRDFEGAAQSNGDLSSLHRQILNGIALLRDIGEPKPTIAQVGAVIGKSHNAGRIRGGFNQVHEMGYAEISGNNIQLTPTGTREAIALDIRNRADIHNLWYQRLKGNELEFLRVLVNNFPDSVRLSDLGAAIGKDINAGRIRGALNALFDKGLATLDGDVVTASDLLFPPGLN